MPTAARRPHHKMAQARCSDLDKCTADYLQATVYTLQMDSLDRHAPQRARVTRRALTSTGASVPPGNPGPPGPTGPPATALAPSRRFIATSVTMLDIKGASAGLGASAQMRPWISRMTRLASPGGDREFSSRVQSLVGTSDSSAPDSIRARSESRLPLMTAA